MNRNTFFPVFLILLCACSAQKKLSYIDFSNLYNKPICEPEFKILHLSRDSSLLYFSFNMNDLLFKKNESGSMSAALGLEYSLYNSYRSTMILDSASINEQINYDSTGSGYTGQVAFYALYGNNYILKIKFIDLNRTTNYTYTINVIKTGKQSSQFFDMRYLDDQPYMKGEIQQNEKVKIIPPELLFDSLTVRCYFRDFPLAPPPFSEIPSAKFEYTADSIYYLKLSALNSVGFSQRGFYHFQIDTLTKDGYSVYVFNDDFPAFTSPEPLIESLRYLCTRSEYNDLSAKMDKKKAIDDYWLAKAGNNERGRKLIRTYYNRTLMANKLFTSYLEGWKTDRGMIYIIFGPPQKVYRDKMYETWRYSVSEGMPVIQFNFNKIQNAFSENDFELERNLNYQSIWYQAVDTWRSGRIVGEN